jgi:AraC-like DNA-binding protein
MDDDAGRGGEARGLLRDDVLLEWYRYPPGPPVELAAHAHEEYQLNLNLDLPGGVRYRGAYHRLAAGTLAVIMPDEVHTPRDPQARETASTHLTLYVGPGVVHGAARQLAGDAATGSTDQPWFNDLVVDDVELVRRFARLHRSLAGTASALDQDDRLLAFLIDLLQRHGHVPAARSLPAGHRAVGRARDYLHDNLTANVSLAELARVGGASPYYLARLFTARLGMPPHAYQIQLRVERAKRLLLTGTSVSDTAHETGFFDLSHFTRHFKRHVGVPPGTYARTPA